LLNAKARARELSAIELQFSSNVEVVVDVVVAEVVVVCVVVDVKVDDAGTASHL